MPDPIHAQLAAIDSLMVDIIDKSKWTGHGGYIEDEKDINRQLQDCLNHRVKLISLTNLLKSLNLEVNVTRQLAIHPAPVRDVIVVKDERTAKKKRRERARAVDVWTSDDEDDHENDTVYKKARVENNAVFRVYV